MAFTAFNGHTKLDVIVDDDCVVTASGVDPQFLIAVSFFFDINHMGFAVDQYLQLVARPTAHMEMVSAITGFHLQIIIQDLRFCGVTWVPVDDPADFNVTFGEQQVRPAVNDAWRQVGRGRVGRGVCLIERLG